MKDLVYDLNSLNYNKFKMSQDPTNEKNLIGDILAEP